MTKLKTLLAMTLLISSYANAVSWIYCGCSSKSGDFKRSCYSTTSCQNCCCYQNDFSTKCKEQGSYQNITSGKIDHESKFVTMIEPGHH